MTETRLNIHQIQKIKDGQGADVFALHKKEHRMILARVGTHDEFRSAVNSMACLLNGLAVTALTGVTEQIGGVKVGVLHNHLGSLTLGPAAVDFFRYAQDGLSEEANAVGYLAWHATWVSGATWYVAGMKSLDKGIGPLLDLVYGYDHSACVQVGDTPQVSLKLRLKEALAQADKAGYSLGNKEFFMQLIDWMLNARRLMVVHELPN